MVRDQKEANEPEIMPKKESFEQCRKIIKIHHHRSQRKYAKKGNIINNGKCNSGDKKEKKRSRSLAGSQKTFESLNEIRDNL